jgi:hypothetical protein
MCAYDVPSPMPSTARGPSTLYMFGVSPPRQSPEAWWNGRCPSSSAVAGSIETGGQGVVKAFMWQHVPWKSNAQGVRL